jgi:hypothetical protein
MTKRVLLAALLFFAAMPLFAQQANPSGYKEGFIISLSNDTIPGEVEYRLGDQRFKSFTFKRGEQVQNYTAGEVNGYGFKNGKVYSARVVEDAFVECLVLGEMNLYRHVANFLVQKKGDKVHVLETGQSTIVVDGRSMQKEDTRWKGVLSYLTQDCGKGVQSSDRLKYDERDLTEFVIAYNRCTGTQYVEVKEGTSWTIINIGFLAGVTQSTFTTNNTSLNYRYLSPRYQSIDPVVGIVLSMHSPRISDRLLFQPELHVMRSSFSGTTQTNFYGVPESNHVNIDLTTLSVPVSFKYVIPKERYSLFLQGGASMDWSIMATTTRQREIDYGSTIYKDQPKAFEVKKNQLGYWGGLGVTKSFSKVRGDVTIRYSSLAPLDNVREATSRMNRVSLALIIYKN